jgi:hypothetical protein
MATTKLTLARWRSRRSVAVAGILFAVLLMVSMATIRLAWDNADPRILQSDAERRRLVTIGLHLVPFAGIAFLWFVGVLREQVGAVEDRLFSSVFLGSGLLFLAMVFMVSVSTASVMTVLPQAGLDARTWAFERSATQNLISVYALRMAAVFTLSVSTLGIRTASFPRWISFVGYAVAAMLLIAAGEHHWVQFAFPAWVLLLSIAILVVRREPADHLAGGARRG